MASDASKLLRGLFWLIILVFVSFFVSVICYPFYILFGILSACIPDCKVREQGFFACTNLRHHI